MTLPFTLGEGHLLAVCAEMQNPWRNISVSSPNDHNDHASSSNQWGKQPSTSFYALGTAACKPSHHSSPSKYWFSAGPLSFPPSFHAAASIFTHQLIIDDTKHGTTVSPATHKQCTVTLLLLPHGRVILVSMEGVKTQVCYYFFHAKN